MQRKPRNTVSRVAAALALACSPLIGASGPQDCLASFPQQQEQNQTKPDTIQAKDGFGESLVEHIRFSPIPPLTGKSNAQQVAFFQDANRIDQLLGEGSNANTDEARSRARFATTAGLPNATTLKPAPVSNGFSSSPTNVNTPPPTMTSPFPTETTYQLQRQEWRAFEQQLSDNWGQQLQVRTSDDGRYSRVQLPIASDGNMQMLIDRAKNLIHFEGSESLVTNWQSLVANMDHDPQSRTASRLMQVPANRIDSIVHVAHEMGFQEPQQPDEITKSFQLNESQQQTITPEVLQQMGIQGPIRIQIDRELGMIFISGDEEDVQKAEKMIDLIRQTAMSSLPVIERIPLVNQTGTAAAVVVQQAYDTNFSSIQGPASVSALPQDDGLLAIGAKKAVESIRMIAEQIDIEADLPPGTGEFTVFRLVHMSAIDAKERVDSYFGQSTQNQRTQTQPQALPVVAIADFRSNTLIVKGAPSYLKQVETLLAKIDVAETTDGATDLVKVFPLRNSVANDLALVIQSAINGQIPGSPTAETPVTSGNQAGGGGAQGGQTNNTQISPNAAGSNIRIAQLALQQIGQNGEVKNTAGGIMFDVKVVADTNSNSLVVTASKKSMPLVEELITLLDRLPNAETQIKVFQVVNGDAQLLFAMLQTLFGTGTTGGGAQGGAAGQTNSLNSLPLQSAGGGDGATLANLRFTVDIRTNSIIATGPVSELDVVNELLIRLDEDDMQNRRVDVFRLSNAPVLEVAETIATWLAEREAQNVFLTGDVSKFNRRVVVVPEAISNSLLISARPEYFPELEKVIIALDRRPPMVQVEVMIAEVQLNKLDEFGVELGIQDSLLFDRGQTITAPTGNEPINFDFNREAIGNTDVFRETVAGQALSNLGVGRVSTASPGSAGLVLQAGNESISVLMRALQESGCVRILSKPQLMTLENLQGRMQVGSRVPFVIGQTVTDGGNTTFDTQFEQVGVILGVTPRVSPDGMIVMFVDVTNSSLGDVADGTTQPQINETTAQTSIMARHGQTVVFSGLIQESKSSVERGAPILKDIPVIGNLFKFDFEQVQRKELMIFLTPRIVDSEHTLDQLNRSAMDRMHWCLDDVANIYGDFGYDGMQQTSSSTEVFYPGQDPGGTSPQAALPGESESFARGSSVASDVKVQNKNRK